VLTRRSVLAIVFMAFMVLSSLRFASYRAHEEELERKRQDKARDEARKRGMHRNNDMIDGGSQTGDGLPAAAAAIEALSAN
jgi:predicted phosphoribosyltransferase